MPRFVPRQRKHKVRARNEQQNGTSSEATLSNSNQEQIVPLSKNEREARRQNLRNELRASQTSKISSKKQKRLDKYVETKLKREENLDFLQRLEKEKEKFDVSQVGGALQSSKNLGKRSFDEFVHDARNGTVAAQNGSKIRLEEQSIDSDDESGSVDSFEAEHENAFDPLKAKDFAVEVPKLVNVPAAGSGLAQPLMLDPNGMPIIPTRRSTKKPKKQKIAVLSALEADEDEGERSEESTWEGFSADEEEGESASTETSDDNALDSDESIEESASDFSQDQSSDTDDVDKIQTEPIKPRNSAFKSWATQQLNKSVGHVPSYESKQPELLPPPSKPIANPVTEAKIPELPSKPNRFAYTVKVNRLEAIQQFRMELPILQKEQEIMEAIYNNPVVLIKGTTGSGKTTQIPQFLFEAGFGSPDGPTPGMIGITQPRRVAAVSMAQRVGEELADQGDKVAYQIRFDSTTSPKTAVKFMTDGILLRELSQDLLLKKYSVIVLDEAHERSVNTDILIGMLSKIVPARMKKNQYNPNPTPLKLIIMSATLNVQDFLHDGLFTDDTRPVLVEAEGRQHRVTTHFALRSRPDYIEETIEKVKRAHRQLPRGGMLVFLTGQNEIKIVQDRLQHDLVGKSETNFTAKNPRVLMAASELPLETEDMDFGYQDRLDSDHDDFDIDIKTQSEDEAEEHEFDISDDEEAEADSQSNVQRLVGSSKQPYTSVHILPLYSQLPTKEQLRVFQPSPEGSRLIVLATNVAETSLTIPGIRYVFDSGRSKERKYNLDTGVQNFEIDYISKASANQRAGRAGRTGPGHCWRLYSSAVYEQFFPDHAEPEILRAPAESIVLQLKGFSYPKPVSEFPFPTPPALQTLDKAESLLRNLGALSASGTITELGKELAIFPLSPRLGKILAQAVREPALLPHVVKLISVLAVSEIFIPESQIDLTVLGRQEGQMYTMQDQMDDDAREKRKQEYGRIKATLSRHDKTSDVAKLFTAAMMYAAADDKPEFCREYFLRPKALNEASLLQGQLLSMLHANYQNLSTSKHKTGIKLSSKQINMINSIAASGYIDQIAVRYDQAPAPPDIPTKPRRAIDVPYLPLIPLTNRGSAELLEKAVFIHPSSVLSRLSTKDLPQYIIYSHLQKSQSGTVASGVDATTPKTRMLPLTPVSGPQICELAKGTSLIRYGKPVPQSKIVDLSGTPKRRECWVTTELHGGVAGSFGWPLPPTQVRQVMDVKSASGWRVDEYLT